MKSLSLQRGRGERALGTLRPSGAPQAGASESDHRASDDDGRLRHQICQ